MRDGTSPSAQPSDTPQQQQQQHSTARHMPQGAMCAHRRLQSWCLRQQPSLNRFIHLTIDFCLRLSRRAMCVRHCITGAHSAYKSRANRKVVSAGFAPTINARGALGGLAERPPVLDAPRQRGLGQHKALHTAPASPCLSMHRSTDSLSIYPPSLNREWAPVWCM